MKKFYIQLLHSGATVDRPFLAQSDFLPRVGELIKVPKNYLYYCDQCAHAIVIETIHEPQGAPGIPVDFMATVTAVTIPEGHIPTWRNTTLQQNGWLHEESEPAD